MLSGEATMEELRRLIQSIEPDGSSEDPHEQGSML